MIDSNDLPEGISRDPDYKITKDGLHRDPIRLENIYRPLPPGPNGKLGRRKGCGCIEERSRHPKSKYEIIVRCKKHPSRDVK